jgi:hypothetical protein
MDQQLFGSQLPMAEGPVEPLNHKSGIYPLIQRPAHHSAAEQVHPYRQVQPASGGAVVRM